MPGPQFPTMFDPRLAFEHVRRLTALGPRPAGSEALAKARAHIVRELASYGYAPQEQTFTADTPLGPVPMANIIAERPGERPEGILLAGHYDTKRQEGFVGANDGGSSAGLLLELARVFATAKPLCALWFVFFDGEEALAPGPWRTEDPRDHTYGSRHFVSEWKRGGRLARVKAALLADMVGADTARFRKEKRSTPWLVDLLWDAARRTSHGGRFSDETGSLYDDHVSFLEAGVPALVLGDDAYPHWHTNADTLDKIGLETLRAAGEALAAGATELFRRFAVEAG